MESNLKKLAIVVNNSWYAWNMRTNLALSFQKKGYDVFFICPSDEYTEKIKDNFKYISIDIDSKGTNPFNDIKLIFKYYRIYKELNPSIILHYTIKPNIYGTIASYILKIPSINNIAGLGTLFIKQNLVTKIAKLLYKISQNKAKKVFFQNKEDYELFTREGLVRKEISDILPGSGVDIEKFKPRQKINSNKFKFLLVSRMLWAKGVGEYVEAAKKLKDKYENVEFELLGHLDFPSPTAISKEQMKEWTNNDLVKYLGSSDDVRIELSDADCIVLPSYYREGTPRVLLESASMQKPIITTNNVGCRDVVDDNISGFICNPQDVDDLVLKMDKMFNLSKEERIQMGKAGRKKIIKEYDEKIVIHKYLEVVNEILK